MSRVQVVAIAWLAFVIGLVVLHAALPQRSGVIALTEVFEPYLLITAIVAAVIAAPSRYRAGRILAVVLVGLLLVRCGPLLVSAPTSNAGSDIRLMTWNVLAEDSATRTVEAVLDSGAGLVALQELQPDAAAALEANSAVTAGFPNRALEPESTVLGLGLLSAFPIHEHSVSSDPPFLRAVVAIDPARPTIVYVIHPLPARISMLARFPTSLDTTRRDADIAVIRGQIDADLAAGREVLVMGDLNTTEREPAYHDMAAGLQDAHDVAGLGPGLTWRPESLGFLPFGLLRIDYIFVSSQYAVFAAGVECYPGSDHCSVHASIDRPGEPI
jgi:vancomycin resistance protein VanJ